jgi:hypothetical protein
MKLKWHALIVIVWLVVIKASEASNEASVGGIYRPGVCVQKGTHRDPEYGHVI